MSSDREVSAAEVLDAINGVTEFITLGLAAAQAMKYLKTVGDAIAPLAEFAKMAAQDGAGGQSAPSEDDLHYMSIFGQTEEDRKKYAGQVGDMEPRLPRWARECFSQEEMEDRLAARFGHSAADRKKYAPAVEEMTRRAYGL
jgi:hypothetical protein